MVAQGKSRVEGKTEFTKHMIRMRHAGPRSAAAARGERNHPDQQPRRRQLVPDAGGRVSLRLCNGLVVGNVSNDIRIPHKGNIQGEVIEGAFRVLDDFEAVDASTDGMKALTLQARRRTRLRHGGTGAALR